MHRLTCSVSGWGSVQNPHNEDERLLIEDGALEVDSEELAHALEDEYVPLTLVESTEGAEEQPTCAGNDGECSRAVDSEGDYCWQHAKE